MKLPQKFLEKMNNLLGEAEYARFMEAYSLPRYYGLRVNRLKLGVDDFKKISPFSLEPIPWTRDGFYYNEGDNPGKHPYYYAGLYYIQEPSAMLPGTVIDAQPGERVLDLCAAPGGKSVQIAAAMKGKGLLVANDINYERVKALVKNIELCGVRNAIVTNESPERLSKAFGAYFERIIIDAPCSGEGMFRKDPDAARSWENYKCEKCAGMQWDILQHAHNMLKPGGRLVYSTCTFSPEEDEKMIARFVNTFGCYEILEIPVVAGIDKGNAQWADGNERLSGTVRLWPHKLKGEGHFVAMLQKKKKETYSFGLVKENDQRKAIPQMDRCLDSIDALTLFRDFEKQNLNIRIDGCFSVKGSNLYCLPEPAPCLDTLKVAKFGWYLGELQKDRFEPSHSFLVSLKKDDIKRTISFNSNSAEVVKYLKGETLILEGDKGFTGICVDGYTLGWAKQTGDMLKNLYPKGWRKTT